MTKGTMSKRSAAMRSTASRSIPQRSMMSNYDARPDRIDLRDREYRPPLISLPPQYPEPEKIHEYKKKYVDNGMILNQGNQGACTGFGLAAVINYLLWRRNMDKGVKSSKKVSMQMLYQLARFYDEWPGEDYEGSSCRGAMKGWHRHGVCREDFWPYSDKKFAEPHSGWDTDAAKRPLGAYYRINKDSISDMQAAIKEVGAIYVSANVHDGWFPKTWEKDGEFLLIGSPKNSGRGGHAFALVGYTERGFIVQNSWGEEWGDHGFAVLPYSDWVLHGMDAWVAVLGAPMQSARSRHYLAPSSLESAASRPPVQFFGGFNEKEQPHPYEHPEVAPWDQDNAYRHTVVMGNNGLFVNRSITRGDSLRALQDIILDKPAAWLSNRQIKKVVFYAHGGLNDEEASIKRVSIMAPYFDANGIYPIFYTWRTGFMESLLNIMGDAAQGVEPQRAWKDIWKKAKEGAKDIKDRAIEASCRKLLVKPIWDQIKQNAQAAVDFPHPENATVNLTVDCLRSLKTEFSDLEIHLVGHSAGSILLGHMLDSLGREGLNVQTCTLFAPACTVDFAVKHYIPALEKGVLRKENTFFDILTDKQERADSVGPYGKSLLYLVSRALERFHKTPLLGMAATWDSINNNNSSWSGDTLDSLRRWQGFWGSSNPLSPHGGKSEHVWDGQGYIPLAHGSFDNDVEVLKKTVQRIAGVTPLKFSIENLRGY
jgi:hypothetical protein